MLYSVQKKRKEKKVGYLTLGQKGKGKRKGHPPINLVKERKLP